MNYPTDLVFAAACAAQRINGEYIKNFWPDTTVVNTKPTNRSIMLNALAPGVDVITNEDTELGMKVRQHYQGLTFKLLQNIKLSEFEQTAMTIADLDEISSNYHLALICSFPGCYLRDAVRAAVNTRVNFATGGYIGVIGNKTVLEGEVIKSFYSQKWETNYVTVMTTDDQAIFFSIKQPPAIGAKVKITGTIKAHRDNQTQLSRVKVLA